MQESFLLGATAKTAPDREALQQQKLRLQNAKNIITTLTIMQSKPLMPMLSIPPLFEQPSKETCWHVGWCHTRVTVDPSALVLDCGQKEHWQHGLCVGLIWFWLFQRTAQYYCCPLVFSSVHTYCLPNVLCFL